MQVISKSSPIAAFPSRVADPTARTPIQSILRVPTLLQCSLIRYVSRASTLIAVRKGDCLIPLRPFPQKPSLLSTEGHCTFAQAVTRHHAPCAMVRTLGRPMQLKMHAILATFLLGGCAGIRMQIPQMTPYTKAVMLERFEEGIPPSLDLPADERQRFAHRAADPIHGAAITMCDRIFGPEHGCASRLSRYRLTVKPQSPVVNAHIDLKNTITVYGGLIRLVGSDDELAAVLAHEYAHGLLGHVRGKMQNIIVGTLVGMAAGAAVGAAAGDDPDDVAEAATIGAETGQLAGVRAYSQAMENEADHVGLFILREAGYEMEAASHLHMRLLNATRSAPRGKEDPTLLYIRTHPGSRERIQKLIGAERMIEDGHLSPVWKR